MFHGDIQKINVAQFFWDTVYKAVVYKYQNNVSSLKIS